jgi:serine/threonine protein phosphatase PrpC
VVVAAVADGHGSQRSPRSATGADLAVRVACQLTWPEVRDGVASPLAASLPERIWKMWAEAISAQVRLRPLEPDETDDGDALLAYGSTLLVAALGEDALLLQLGDGDVLLVRGDEPVSVPLPQDPNHVGEDTASLCQNDAPALFRSAYVTFDAREPALIVLATDGYSKSFASDADFLQVGTDLRAMIEHEGIDQVREALHDWLRQASDEGSGDDVTVALAWSPGAA